MEKEDNYEGLLRKALAIDELPDDFDPTRIPQTGEEYIHYVMYEAKQCDEWVTADIDTNKFQKRKTTVFKEPTGCIKAPSELLPSEQWQHQQIADFTALRSHLDQIRTDHQIPQPQFNGESKQWHTKCSTEPTVTDLLALNQRGICKVLSFHLDWLGAICATHDCLPRAHAIWLYALLACTQTPLMPETCADLREIARKCSEIRANLHKDSNEKDYKPLNLIICIIARFFHNYDLIDQDY